MAPAMRPYFLCIDQEIINVNAITRIHVGLAEWAGTPERVGRISYAHVDLVDGSRATFQGAAAETLLAYLQSLPFPMGHDGTPHGGDPWHWHNAEQTWPMPDDPGAHPGG